MTKTYSYQFSYYWKITWNEEAAFKNDTANYKGFKQRIKRECKVNLDEKVILYLNLRWVTTLGRMQSLFPNSQCIEVSSPEEFSTMKDAKEVKQVVNRKTYKLRRVLEPSEDYSYTLREIAGNKKIDQNVNQKRLRGQKSFQERVEDDILRYEPEFFGEPDVEIVKKKVHNELDEKSTVSTEYGSYSPKKYFDEAGNNHYEEKREIFEMPNNFYFQENDNLKAWEKEEMKKDQEKFDENLETKWEENAYNQWDNDGLNNIDFIPQRLRNYEMENSITPFSWDDPHPQRSYFDLL